MIIQAIVSLVATLSFSIVIGVPKKYLLLAGSTGAIGWIVYLCFMNIGYSTVFASLLSALVIAIISVILSKALKAIVSIFFVPGILPIVPGVAVYKTAYYILNNNSYMTKKYFYQTILIAGAIALSIFIVESIGKFKVKRKVKG